MTEVQKATRNYPSHQELQKKRENASSTRKWTLGARKPGGGEVLLSTPERGVSPGEVLQGPFLEIENFGVSIVVTNMVAGLGDAREGNGERTGGIGISKRRLAI